MYIKRNKKNNIIIPSEWIWIRTKIDEKANNDKYTILLILLFGIIKILSSNEINKKLI